MKKWLMDIHEINYNNNFHEYFFLNININEGTGKWRFNELNVI